MGLIGGMARTAVVAGTATAPSNRVSRRQAGRWAAQSAQEYPPQQYQQPVSYAAPAAPAAPSQDELIERLEGLGPRDQKILTDAEFEEQKARLLGS